MVYDNTNYDNVTAWFDSDILGIMKVIHTLGSPDDVGKPAFTSDVVRDGGWLGGAPAPPKPEDTPDSAVHLIPPVFNAVVAAMENTTFGPGNAWFRNEAANRAFNLANNKNNLTLDIPVFFVNGYWDAICDTVTGNLADRMRRTCSDLTEVVINAGHWVNTDQPEKVNSAMERWIFEKVIDFWPGKALPTL